MTRLETRIDRLEDRRFVSRCDHCHGYGNRGPFGDDQPIPSPICSTCGRVATRQHVVQGITQAELDIVFRVERNFDQ